MVRRLFSPDPEPGSSQPAVDSPAPAPAIDTAAPASAAPAPTSGAAPPPAATLVVNGHESEETLRLREENARLQKTVKDREAEVATTRDEYHQYRQTVEQRPAPTPRAKSKFVVGGLFSGSEP